MQQFTVPQFIERETRVFGPISVRQFFLMLTAGGLIVLSYKLIPSAMGFIAASILIAGVFSIFAFVKVNGRPFHYFILNASEVYTRPKLRLWNRSAKAQSAEKIQKERSASKKEMPEPLAKREPLTSSRLSKLSLVVDTGGAYRESE